MRDMFEKNKYENLYLIFMTFESAEGFDIKMKRVLRKCC